jgi:hypothetical protein
MTPYEQAARVYEREPCARSFQADLEAHLFCGWVVSTPLFFVMGRRVMKRWPAEMTLNPHYTHPQGDGWHVWLAAGDLRAMWAALPAELEWISYERRNVLRVARLARLRSRVGE